MSAVPPLLRVLPRLAPAAGVGLLYLLSSLPPSALAGVPLFPGADKVVHASLYAALLLSFRGWRGWRRTAGEWLPGALAGCLVAALCDEAHQFLVPGRSPEIGDLLADLGGALAAALLCLGWSQLPLHRRLG